MIYIYTFLILFSFNLYSDPKDKIIHIVKPANETPQVISKGDAADDPAIWFNQFSPNNSIIFGTDKRSGVYSYNLAGKKIGYSNLGNINNIDIRSINFDEEGTYTFIVASNRTVGSIDFWIYEDKALDILTKTKKFSLNSSPSFQGISNMVVYGVCVGFDEEFGVVAFLTEDEGSSVEMWSYSEEGLSLLTTFSNANATQSEGCVYDDENRTLFISEEQDRGVLRAYKLNNELDFSSPHIIDNRSGNIDGDPEGVTIYKSSETEGYVILSSQGDNSFNVYDRKFPYNYLGSFKVGSSGNIDNVNDTDGVDVISNYINYKYPKGLLVVQDGTNDGKKIVKRQNFKYVSFEEVIKALEL